MPDNTWGSRPQRRGQRYEQLAAEFFSARGFTILEQNWRASHKEIDLITQKDNLIVFVEVKSAHSKSYGHPAEKIDRRKIELLTKAAQQYLIDHDISGCDLRFDVVAFVDGRLEHFPDAFEAQ